MPMLLYMYIRRDGRLRSQLGELDEEANALVVQWSGLALGCSTLGVPI